MSDGHNAPLTGQPSFNLRQLEYFVAVARTGSMTSAGQSLHVSPSAVSVALGDLERRCGTQLMLRRRAKGLSLTAAGRRLLPQAANLLARAGELQASLQDLGDTPSGPLAVGCFTPIAPFVVPGLLCDLRGAYPEIVVSVLEGAQSLLSDALLAGDCELAVLYDVDLDPRLEREVLHEVRPHVLLPEGHPLSERERVSLADLGDLDMVLLDLHPSARYFTQVLADAGVSPRVRHRCSSVELVRGLVARGSGFSLLVQRPAAPVSHDGYGLVTRPIAEPLPPIDVVLARCAGTRPTRCATVFRDLCRESLPPSGVTQRP